MDDTAGRTKLVKIDGFQNIAVHSTDSFPRCPFLLSRMSAPMTGITLVRVAFDRPQDFKPVPLLGVSGQSNITSDQNPIGPLSGLTAGQRQNQGASSPSFTRKTWLQGCAFQRPKSNRASLGCLPREEFTSLHIIHGLFSFEGMQNRKSAPSPILPSAQTVPP